ncbi:hypothetical protein [Burkholderia sp. WSM2230]|uniref:hypothetical protein n=1 Tax=Burkholderia sp. WSM2230 TaxID=944435 RepID=UPI0012EB60C9|nr:hypothetical protein [Burkholderia sp. WSM2230]
MENFSVAWTAAIAPGNNFCMRGFKDPCGFFRAMLLHMKVELSKFGLYYTRALEAKQNSGFSLELKNRMSVKNDE